MPAIIIKIKSCPECMNYDIKKELNWIANDIARQLKEVSLTISSNRQHIKSIKVIED